jgi:hypothetical protein
MRTERVLWQFAVVYAVLLLFAPLTPRTTWSADETLPRGNPSSVRDAAGWDMVAPIAGVVAIVGLVAGYLSRPLVIVPVIGAAIATTAFAVAARAAGTYWLDLLRGAPFMPDFTMYPAPGPPFFAIVATVATGFALVLMVSWLKPGEDAW